MARKNTPSLKTRGKRWGVIAAASMGGFMIMNTAASRSWPLVSPAAKKLRGIVTGGL